MILEPILKSTSSLFSKYLHIDLFICKSVIKHSEFVHFWYVSIK